MGCGCGGVPKARRLTVKRGVQQVVVDGQPRTVPAAPSKPKLEPVFMSNRPRKK